MSSYIDLKFINDISSRLTLFKKKGDYFSTLGVLIVVIVKRTKQFETEHFLYRVKNDMFFKCNCGTGQSLI